MTEEQVTNDGSLEAAAGALSSLRAEAVKEQPAPDTGAPAATVESPQADTPPEQPDEAADAGQQTEVDADQTTIEIPSWLSAEERELFVSLPPESQQAIQRLAKSTQASESRRQNEHAERLRQYEQEAEAARQERQYLQSAIRSFAHPLQAQFQQEFADVLNGQMDLIRLSQDPERWARYQGFSAEFQRIGEWQRQIDERATHEERQRLAQHIESRNNELKEWKPDLKDPQKFDAYDAELTGYLRERGVPDHRIARLSLTEVQIVDDAMKWRKAQKAKAAAPTTPPQPQPGPGQVSVQGHIRTVPKVMKPGTTKDSGAVDDKIAAMDQRLAQTGSLDDAAEAIRLRRLRRA